MFNLNIQTLSLSTEFFKLIFMEIFTYCISLKITNNELNLNKNRLIDFSGILLISIIVMFIRDKFSYSASILVSIILISMLVSKITNNKLGYATLAVIISLGINYIILYIAITINFFINVFYTIQNDNINLIIITVIQIILMGVISKIKRIKNGISFLNKNVQNDYLNITIINISVIVSFSFLILSNPDVNLIITKNIFINFLLFALLMFITIKESISTYYKQKLLIRDLTETKKELEEKKKELEDLEKENLKFSMRSHSIAHKQRALEYKLNKVLQSSEVAEEIDLKNRMENLAKEAYVAPLAMELTKTEIDSIDDMLEYMQAECVKDNIEFNLQVNGNIHKMVNNYVEKQDLEILLADHIKDAIIAVNHTDNINRSILVKLGEFDNCYSLNIYDSGVNFPKEILENLGKNPVTSYPNEGGTGMGYMNTFETLRKYDASLIIEEFGMPSKENFTKVVSIKFDKKNEFKIL